MTAHARVREASYPGASAQRWEVVAGEAGDTEVLAWASTKAEAQSFANGYNRALGRYRSAQAAQEEAQT